MEPAPPGPAVRHPAIARACLYLNWMFLLLWGVYLSGPDALGWPVWPADHRAYGLFSGAFFLYHFVLISTGIIALFVVIIEVHAGRRVRGFRGVIVAVALPIASFLYFAARYLMTVRSWLDR